MPSVGCQSERSFWNVPGGRDHGGDRLSGLDQYVGGYGTSPNQGTDPAFSELWRVFSSLKHDMHRNPDEPYRSKSRGKGVRILIVGGGAGGHLFPDIALAEAFMKKDLENQIQFVVTRRPLDAQVLGERGYSFRVLNVEGIKGKGVAGKMRSMTMLPRF